MQPLEDLLKKAQTLNEAEKYSEVIELLPEDVLETHQSADLYAEKAQAFYRLDKTYLCSEAVEKALLIDEYHSKANHYKGNLYLDSKEYDKAIQAYNEAIKTDPKYAAPYYGLGIVYKELKEYHKAIIAYNKAIEIDPAFTHPYNALGNVLSELKEYDKAIIAYNKAIEIDPAFKRLYNGLGNVLSDKKEYDKAIETYNKAIRIDPKYAPPYYGLGIVYSELKEYDKAIVAYNKAIEIDPAFSYPFNGLGNVYLNLKENAKAIIAYNKAIEINPAFTYPYHGLGVVYLNLKEYGKAIIALNKAIEIDPQFNGCYYSRGLVYEALLKYSQALVDFEKYYELTKGTDDYFTKIAQSKIEELKKISGSIDYKKISELVVKIKKLLMFHADCVTHYTGLLATKALIFEQSKFRLSEGAFLNDTSEGRELFKFLPDLRKSTPINETIALPFIQKPFIGSFVSEIKHDDLTLWRMYGKENKDEARGCAITLNRGKLLENLKESLIKDGKTEITEKMDEEFSFYRVAYRKEGEEELFIIPGASAEDQNSLNEYMLDLASKVKKIHLKRRKASDIQNVLELLSSIAYLFKSAEYQYEHELRLVIEGIGFKKIINTELTQPRVYIELVPICPFISKITLGPKVERADEWAAAFYYSLDQQDYHPEILISHLPFK